MNDVDIGPYGQIILFGDSITEQSADQERGFAFMPALQNSRSNSRTTAFPCYVYHVLVISMLIPVCARPLLVRSGSD